MLRSVAGLVVLATFVQFFMMQSHTMACEDQQARSKAAILAYENNLKQFKRFKCRYAFTKAIAGSLEDALEGKYREQRKCEYSHIVDGDREKFQCIAPPIVQPNEMRELGGNLSGFSVEFISYAHVSLGSNWLEYYHGVSPDSATLKDKRYKKSEDSLTPLFMGVSGPNQQLSPFKLLQGQDDRVSMNTKGIVQVDGRPLLHVGFKAASLWGEMDFYFDPQQGHLPYQVIRRYISPEKAPYPESRVYLKSAKECRAYASNFQGFLVGLAGGSHHPIPREAVCL